MVYIDVLTNPYTMYFYFSHVPVGVDSIYVEIFDEVRKLINKGFADFYTGIRNKSLSIFRY